MAEQNIVPVVKKVSTRLWLTPGENLQGEQVVAVANLATEAVTALRTLEIKLDAMSLSIETLLSEDDKLRFNGAATKVMVLTR